MKKKIKIKSNVMEGYDKKGKLIMYYWQKEPIKTLWGVGNWKVSWKFRFNPIWRIKQWWYSHKGIIYHTRERIK